MEYIMMYKDYIYCNGNVCPIIPRQSAIRIGLLSYCVFDDSVLSYISRPRLISGIVALMSTNIKKACYNSYHH